MRIISYNKDNLTDNEIDITVTRVKVFLLNNKDEFLLATANNGYQLPGGHVENGEDLLATVKRELKEETGIELEDNEISNPFFEIRYYKKYYKDAVLNRLSKVVYFIVHTDKIPDISNTKLTRHEQENNFAVQYIPRAKFETLLRNYLKTATIDINVSITNEILAAYEELKKII